MAATGGHEVAATQWLRLAEAREPTAPGDVMAVHLRLADDLLVRADKRAYRDAIRLLKAAQRPTTIAEVLHGGEPMGDLSRFAIEDLTPEEEDEFFGILEDA